MKHVTHIRKMVNEGALEEAHQAIEDLLQLGPQNLEALKLKASMYEYVGRFEEEEQVWRRVIEIDNEDEEALHFFQKAQLEDREHYYFTDPLPGGGRRFLAYPRTLVSVSFIGLIGCVAFLLLTRANTRMITESPILLLVSFAIMVLSPWFAIIWLYIRTIRSINISQQSLEVRTRFRTLKLAWPDIQQICLAHSGEPSEGELALIIVPKTESAPLISIDFSETTSPVRARKHLIQEIRDHYHAIAYAPRPALDQKTRQIKRF